MFLQPALRALDFLRKPRGPLRWPLPHFEPMYRVPFANFLDRLLLLRRFRRFAMVITSFHPPSLHSRAAG
jgi:hypothetical protein